MEIEDDSDPKISPFPREAEAMKEEVNSGNEAEREDIRPSGKMLGSKTKSASKKVE